MTRLLPCLLALLAAPLPGAVVHVRAGAPGGGDGSSWAAAYASLSAALAAARSGDEIWLAAGTYKPGGARSSAFALRAGVPVYGGFLGGETARDQRSRDPALSVLSGEIGGAQAEDNCRQVVTASGAGAFALDGVTVTRNWNDLTSTNLGAAIYADQVGSLRLANVRMVDCAGYFHAALHFDGGGELEMEDCLAVGCRLFAPSAAYATRVVMAHASGRIALARCAVAGTAVAAATSQPGVMLWAEPAGSTVAVESCLVAGNACGGLDLAGSGTATIAFCTFAGNSGSNVHNASTIATQIIGCIVQAPFVFETGATLNRTWTTTAWGDPAFVDPATPAGADGIWLTADDGFALRASSPCREWASGAATVPASDLRGVPRPRARVSEPGAYEYDTGNSAPTCTSQALSTPEDTALAITIGGTDLDAGGALQPGTVAEVTALPAAGILRDGVGGPAIGAVPARLSGRVVQYVPAADDHGAGRGTFTARLFDGTDSSLPATIAIDVAAVNDPPTVTAPAAVAMDEDAGVAVVVLSALAPGPANESAQALTITARSGDHALMADPAVSYRPGAATAALTLAPQPDAFGSLAILVTVADDAGGSATAAIAVTIRPVNDPPSFDLPATCTLTEDQRWPTLVPFTGMRAGPANEDETVLLMLSELGATLMVGWSVSFDPATGSGDLVLWPLPDASGAATLVVSAVEIRSDGEPALVTSRLLTVAITPVNDLPTLAVNRPLALGAGATATYTAADLAIADADLPAKDTLVFTLATPPEHGDLLLADAVLAAGATFTQADVEAGRLAYRNRDGLSDQYAVAIGDGVAAPIGPLLVGVTVAGKGRPWLDLGTVDARWREGDEAFLPCAAARLEDGDSPLLDGGRLTVTWGGGQAAGDRLDLLHQGGGAGQLAVEGAALAYGGRPIGSWSGGGAGEALTVLLAGPDATPAAAQAVLRALRFRHQGDDPGLRTTLLEVVADDGDAGASLPARLWITTEPVNDPPRPQAAIIGTMAGVARTAILAASDPDSSALAWTLTGADPALGATLADAASGRVRLAPAAGWSGTGLLTWRVSDGTVAVAATSAVVVTGPDQPRPLPAAEAPALAVAGELVEVVVPWDCADLPAAGPLDFAAAEGAPAGLTVTALDARRMRVAWAVPAAQPAGAVRFTVIATDPVGGASGCWPALISVRARLGGAN